MRAFITGATGFAGAHLVDLLLDSGYDVAALVHEATSHQALPEVDGVRPFPGDLMDTDSLTAAVREAKPDVIFHLAGQAYPTRSWGDPAQTIAINTGGTANLLQAAIAAGQPHVVIVTSAEIYGVLDKADLPITETTIARPRHPYGVSKLAAGQLASVYWERYGLPVVEARPFNHIGPRQAPGFVVPDFAGQLAAIRLGQRPPEMHVGNLDSQRDFTDVRDVVAAYKLLGEGGAPGEAYIICSGRPTSIRELLDEMLALIDRDVTVNIDPARMQPSDTPCIYGSYAKIHAQTCWEPIIPLRQSLADALDDWDARLSFNPA